MEREIKLSQHDYEDTLLELAAKSLAYQQTILSFMCDAKSKTIEEADELYRESLVECNQLYHRILDDIYARRG